MDTMPLNDIKLPPGFRFHPSDEELILHYLQNKATSSPLPASIIAEIELYKFNPWDLPSKAFFGEEEWYFFTPRDRKYPNGVRPNRMAGSGFWKATGTDRPIFSSGEGVVVGVKKALVFYTGKPPRGVKTDWIMHEYRLLEAMPSTSTSNSKTCGSMRLDDWVLCRVRKKSTSPRKICEDRYGHYNDSLVNSPRVDQSVNTNPNLELLNATLFKDCPMLPFIFSSDKLDLSSLDTFSSTISFEGSKGSTNSGRSKFTSAEESFGIQNIPSSDSLTSIHKRKSKEMNNAQEGFVQASKKKYESKEDVTSLISNDAVEMGFYGNQSDQWSYTMEYQEGLNEIVFE